MAIRQKGKSELVRAQIMLRSDQHRAVRQRSAERHESISEFVRDAVDARLSGEERRQADDIKSRRAALKRFLSGPKFDVPDPPELKRMINAMYDERWQRVEQQNANGD